MYASTVVQSTPGRPLRGTTVICSLLAKERNQAGDMPSRRAASRTVTHCGSPRGTSVLVVQPRLCLVGYRVELGGPESLDEVNWLSAPPPGVEKQRRAGSDENPRHNQHRDIHGDER
jgi:hypothetical protein